jgi:hypothetical protein
MKTKCADGRHDLPTVSSLYANAQIIKLYIYTFKLSGWLLYSIQSFQVDNCVSQFKQTNVSETVSISEMLVHLNRLITVSPQKDFFFKLHILKMKNAK